MKVIRTDLPEVLILEPNVFEDERGWFVESFNERVFERALKALGVPVPRLVQDNRSHSKREFCVGSITSEPRTLKINW